MLEAAYAELNGGYVAIEGGWPSQPMTALTGQASSTYEMQDVALGDLADWIEGDQAVTLVSLGDENSPQANPLYRDGLLVTHHVYYVVGVSLERGTVIIQNPWGWNKWDGVPLELTFAELQGAFIYAMTNPAGS